MCGNFLLLLRLERLPRVLWLSALLLQLLRASVGASGSAAAVAVLVVQFLLVVHLVVVTFGEVEVGAGHSLAHLGEGRRRRLHEARGGGGERG